MPESEPVMTGGCQCGAVRYALLEAPVSTLCHCRMCQKAVGGPFAALSKVPITRFARTRGHPAKFQSSSAAERHSRAARGTPLTFHFLDGDAIEVTTGSLDFSTLAPATKNFGVESRLPWIGFPLPDRLPDVSTMDHATREVVSSHHPDRDTMADWSAAAIRP